jgi:hypothetical protein
VDEAADDEDEAEAEDEDDEDDEEEDDDDSAEEEAELDGATEIVDEADEELEEAVDDELVGADEAVLLGACPLITVRQISTRVSFSPPCSLTSHGRAHAKLRRERGVVEPRPGRVRDRLDAPGLLKDVRADLERVPADAQRRDRPRRVDLAGETEKVDPKEIVQRGTGPRGDEGARGAILRGQHLNQGCSVQRKQPLTHRAHDHRGELVAGLDGRPGGGRDIVRQSG